MKDSFIASYIAKGWDLVYDGAMYLTRYQFQAFRVLFGLGLVFYFASIAWVGVRLDYWANQMQPWSWHQLISHYPNVLERVPIGYFGLALCLVSVFLMIGLSRRFYVSLLLYGMGTLLEARVIALGAETLALILLFFLMLIVPEREGKHPQWRFPRGLEVYAHGLLVFFYAVYLNPFELPEQFVGKTTSAFPLELRFFFVLGLLSLVQRKRRYIFWGFALALTLVGNFYLGSFEQVWFFYPLLVLTISPNWWTAPKDELTRVLYYDGQCGLCHGLVKFIVQVQGTRPLIQFCALQSELAKQRLDQTYWPYLENLETVLYQRGDQVLTHSNAAFAILRDLGGIWTILGLGRFLPTPLRDGLYRRVAATRYRWFGKYDQCELPSVSERQHFLEATLDS